MKKYSTRLLLICVINLMFIVSVSGQSFSWPAIEAHGENTRAFVPKGWHIKDSAVGDLNEDRRIDYALILEREDSAQIEEEIEGHRDSVLTLPRILLILFFDPGSKHFMLAERSNTFILDHRDPQMEDPYAGIVIKNGMLSISFHLFYFMGSYEVTNIDYRFRLQQGEFCLIGVEDRSFNRATHDYEDCSYNFITGKYNITTGNESEGPAKKAKTVWDRLPYRPLKTLKTLSAPFTWEVLPDRFL